MRLLFLTSRLPWPPDRGDRLRTFNLLQNLSKEHEIILVSFIADRKETNGLDQLKPFCRDIQLVYLPVWRSSVRALINSWRGLPMQVAYYQSQKMMRLIDQIMTHMDIQATYIHLFRMAPYLSKYPGVYRIVDLTDVISREIANSVPYRSPLSRFVYKIEQRRIAAYECQVAQWADETWLISAREKLLLSQKCLDAGLQLVPNGVNLEKFYPMEMIHQGNDLLFVGNLNVFHNLDALTFMIHDILPIIRAKKPDCRLIIIGAGENKRVRELARADGVTLRGYVNNLNEALNKAAVFVAPLRFSAGIQNKVLEAMAAGVSVVATSNVSAGLGAVPGRELLVADHAQAFAANVIKLLANAQYRQTLGLAGRNFVAQRFSWQVAVQRMRDIEGGLLNMETAGN